MTFIDPGQQALDNIDATVTAAPELTSSPGLTTDTALAGGNVGGSAQAIAQGAKAQMHAQAGNVFAGFFGGAIHDASKVLNAPLGVVQHTYRYLHDVEARHGEGVAILEGLGIAAGLVAGSVLTGGLGDLALGAGVAAEGAADVGSVAAADAAVGAAGSGPGAIEAANAADEAVAGVSRSGGALSKAIKFTTKVVNPRTGGEVLGAEAAGYTEGQLNYHDSWARTANGGTYRDPHTGQMVSFGRDIASGFLHLDHKSATYGEVSGLLDGMADVYGDPLQAGLNVAVAGHTVEGARGLMGASAKYSGYAMTADNIQRKFEMGAGPYYEWTKKIAAEKSGAAIRSLDPRLAPIVEDKPVLKGYETDVSHIPDADFYHGTGYGSEGFQPERDFGNASDNLFGPGFYTTDKKAVALAYSGKRDFEAPVAEKVYGLKWKGEEPAKFLDLEKTGAHADDLADSMKQVLDRFTGGDSQADGLFAHQPEFWDVMNDENAKGSDLYDAWRKMMDEVYHNHEGGEGWEVKDPDMERLYKDLRDAVEDKGYDGFQYNGGQRLGGLGKHVARSFFDPSKLGVAASTNVEHTRLENLMGLKSASTPEEVHSVVMSRSVLGSEAIGHKIPTMTGMKLAMTALRMKTAEAPVDAMHPFAGVLNPKTTVGNLRALFTRTPVGVKGNLAKLDDHLVQGLIQFWTAGVGQNAAYAAADLLPDLDLAGRRNLVRNMYMNNLSAYAGFHAPIVEMQRLGEDIPHDAAMESIKDPAVREKIKEMVDKSWPTRDPDRMGVYGGRLDGSSPRVRVDPDSGKFSSALLRSQVSDDYQIPDLNEFRLTAKLFANGRNALGKMDQALFDTITSRMKSLMLSTGAAYASHMALAEDALNAQRLGLGTLIDGGLNASVAKSQWRALNADYDAVAKAKRAGSAIKQIGVVARSMRRAGRMLGVNLNAEQIAAIQRFAARSISRFVTEDDARYAAEYAILTNGHLVNTELSGESTHGLDGVETMGGSMDKLKLKLGDQYEQIERGRADSRYTPEWQSWHRQAGKDSVHIAAAKALQKAYDRGAKSEQAIKEARAAARAAIAEIPADELAGIDAAKFKAFRSPKTKTATDDWADDVVENVRAITHSPRTIKPNGILLKRLASSEVPGLQELNSIPMEDRPINVPGRVPVPSASHLVDRITESDFQHVAQPIIKSLARMPTATATYIKYRKVYATMVAKGLISDEEAAVKASADTTIDMVRFIHNPEDRVQMDMLLRNWAPFLFAQNQAYRRGLRLLADDPAAFMRYYRSIVGVANVAHQMQDGTGNTYISLPGAGFLTHPMIDAFGMIGGSLSVNPTGFGGTLTSANVIFPMSQGVRPDLSPIILIPAQAVAGVTTMIGNSYPGFSKAAQTTNGALTWVAGKQAMSDGFLTQVIPNSILNNVLNTAAADGVSFNSAMMQTMQNLDYQQRVAYGKWVADGKKGPPPQIMPNDMANVAQKQEFLQKLKNQTRIVWMVKTLLGGVSPLGASVTVNDFGFNKELQDDINRLGVTNGYTHFLEKHPYATAYTAAKSTTAQGEPLLESDAAQNWVVNNMAKIRQNPAFLWFMPQNTNATYDPTVYNEQVADGLRTRDTPQQYLDKIYTVAGDQTYYKAYDIHQANITAAGTNKNALTAEYANWDAYLSYLQKIQPTWWASFNGGTKAADAVQSITQLQDMYAKGEQPQGAMGEGIGELLNQLDEANTAYVAAGQTSNYAHAQKLVRDNWQTQCKQWATANPALAPVINSLFRDALTYENPT